MEEQTMPYVERPDGARIYYEVRGQGFPLLLFAPGGINSQVDFWERSAINPFDYADEFMVIGMNQRNATDSPGPLAATTWAIHAADQRAVLEALGVERTLLWGGCIGVGFVLRFCMEAPERAVAAVGQNPVGYYEGVNSPATFFAMFEPTVTLAREGGMAAVVDAAQTMPLFMANNAGGPFAARIATDPAFRAEVLAVSPAEYERIIRAYNEQMWGAYVPYMSVPADFVRSCATPLLILPGLDEFHPTPLAEQLCREAPHATCLAPDCREPENVPATKERIREFLREHAQRG
jgi:pimeloyl-ACP methyl ester carboxylesterase